MFSADDKRFMKIALKEATNGLNKGDYPVGAVIAIDGKILARGNNSLTTLKQRINHAEMNLMMSHSATITKEHKDGKNLTLYTTLEPCLMCLGTAALHRVSRIVYACRDPNGGATSLIKAKRKGYYKKRWPVIEGRLYEKQSYTLLMKFLKKQSTPGWKSVLKDMEKLKLK